MASGPFIVGEQKAWLLFALCSPGPLADMASGPFIVGEQKAWLLFASTLQGSMAF
jgi:hypothetical protein